MTKEDEERNMKALIMLVMTMSLYGDQYLCTIPNSPAVIPVSVTNNTIKLGVSTDFRTFHRIGLRVGYLDKDVVILRLPDNVLELRGYSKETGLISAQSTSLTCVPI